MIGISGRKIILNGLETFRIPSTCPGVGEVGEWQDKLVNKHPGWNEVLKKSEKSAGIRGRMNKLAR